MSSYAAEHAAIAASVAVAIRDEALTIVVQPIVEVHSGPVLGDEALSRFTGEPRQGSRRT